MMGERRAGQEALFYEFSLERHVPADHLLRRIDRFVDLGGLRAELAAHYSATGRPSIDPELLIRMLIVGYCSGVRSERRLCEEVHLNVAYRWFCRMGLDGVVPDHSTFSKNRWLRAEAPLLPEHAGAQGDPLDLRRRQGGRPRDRQDRRLRRLQARAEEGRDALRPPSNAS